MKNGFFCSLPDFYHCLMAVYRSGSCRKCWSSCRIKCRNFPGIIPGNRLSFPVCPCGGNGFRVTGMRIDRSNRFSNVSSNSKRSFLETGYPRDRMDIQIIATVPRIAVFCSRKICGSLKNIQSVVYYKLNRITVEL